MGTDDNPSANGKSHGLGGHTANGDPAAIKFLSDRLDECSNSEDNNQNGFPSKWCYYKQVLAVGIGWMFLFIAVFALRNLQSSMNHADGLGLITMGTFYGGMMIGAFVSSAIVQTLGPKISLIVSGVFHVAFVAANLIPDMYLLTTVGAVTGIFHSTLWAAQSTYLTTLAKSFSEKYKASYEDIMARFFGLTFLFAELAMVIGNPLASLIIGFEDSSGNSNNSFSEHLNVTAQNNTDHAYPLPLYANASKDPSYCGRHYCHSYISEDSKMQLTMWTRFLVVGFFTASATLALIIFIFTIRERNIYVRKPGCLDLSDKLVGTLLSIFDIKMLLCIPLTTFFGFQMAFVYGDVVKAYITCPLGIHQVGNVMTFYGILDAVAALLGGWLKKFLGSVMMFTIIVSLNGAVFTALLVWSPDDSIWGYVLFAGLGCIQGLTNIHLNSQIGFIFRDSVESAYSVYRLFLGMGLSVGFAYSPHFCMETKIWTAVSLSVIAAVCYYVLEIVHRRSLDDQSRGKSRNLVI